MTSYLRKLDSFKTVLLAMIFVIGYYFFIASNRYVSEISLSVRSSANDTSAVGGLASLVGVAPSSKEDVMHLKEYIHSLDMLKILDKKINLRTLYEAQKNDPFFRLYDWMTQEQFLWYYRNRVEVSFDDMTGLLKIHAQGFTPEQSQIISRAILQECDRFINELSHHISRDQMAFAEGELLKTKQRYQKAKNNLIAFQNSYGVFDPKAQAEAKAGLSTEIESKISQKETELGTMLSYLNETAPQVVTLKSELFALKTQLSKEKAKVVSKSPTNKLNDLAAKFQDLVIEAGFAEDAYKVALASVEKTRLDVNRKVKQLVVIQAPSKPESAQYPDNIYNIITVFIILSMLFGIGKLMKAIIEEHRY